MMVNVIGIAAGPDIILSIQVLVPAKPLFIIDTFEPLVKINLPS